MMLRRLVESLRPLARYPSAVVGLLIIATLVASAVVTVIAIPYGQALELWRGGDAWRMTPVNASPAWVDTLSGANQPRTLIISSDAAEIDESPFPGGKQLRMTLPFDFDYSGFPSEVNLFLSTHFEGRQPFARMTLERPDGTSIVLGSRRLSGSERVSLSQDWDLERRLGVVPHVGLFAETAQDAEPAVLNGAYRLIVEVIGFDANVRVDADLVLYGRVHGWAGTDHQRRDLTVALLWGIPVALAFGLLAAVGTTVTTLVIAAAGVWYGGWIDALIQRLTEVTIILPLLPILVMVGTLYSTSIWIMLGVVITLGIFSAGIKMYRSMLLPIRQAPYIEAARAYGASNARIILRYMIPRILPVLIPTFVVLIPSFVFLEASLALLGLGDPVLPTWGKIMNDAQAQSALYHGFYYWVLAPAALLMLTGLGFAMLGFALDRVFNPRLRMH